MFYEAMEVTIRSKLALETISSMVEMAMIPSKANMVTISFMEALEMIQYMETRLKLSELCLVTTKYSLVMEMTLCSEGNQTTLFTEEQEMTLSEEG